MTQYRALDILKTCGNVFLTGEPGAGKTYVINKYIAYLEACKVKVAVTASTGIAATHIGGMTIHAWSGIGARDALSSYDLDAIATNEKIVRRVKKVQVLVIDEISHQHLLFLALKGLESGAEESTSPIQQMQK